MEASFESLIDKLLEKYRVELSNHQNKLEDAIKSHNEDLELYKKRERQYITSIGKLKNKLLLKSEESKQLRELLVQNNIPIPPLNDLVNIHNKKPHDASNQDYPHTQNTSTEATPTQNAHTEAPPTHTPPTEAPAPPSHNESQDLPGVTEVTPPSPVISSLSSSPSKRSLRLSRPKKRAVYHETPRDNEATLIKGSTSEKEKEKMVEEKRGGRGGNEEQNGEGLGSELELGNSERRRDERGGGHAESDDVVIIGATSPVGVVNNANAKKEGDHNNSFSSDDTIVHENKKTCKYNETIPLFNTHYYDNGDEEEEEELMCCYDNEESLHLLKGEELDQRSASKSPSVLTQALLVEEDPLMSRDLDNQSHDFMSTSCDLSERSLEMSRDLINTPHDQNSESLDLGKRSCDRSGDCLSSGRKRKKRRRKGVATRRSLHQTTMTQHISMANDDVTMLEKTGKSPQVVPPTPFVRSSSPSPSSNRSAWKTDLITTAPIVATSSSSSLDKPTDDTDDNARALALKAGLPPYKCTVPLRKKSDREKLGATSCPECERWYKGYNDLYGDNADHLRKTCRHKHLYQPPESDPTVWNMEFPDTVKVTTDSMLSDT